MKLSCEAFYLTEAPAASTTYTQRCNLAIQSFTARSIANS